MQSSNTQKIPDIGDPLTLTCLGRGEWVFTDQDSPDEIYGMFELASDLVDDGKDARAKPNLETLLAIKPDHIDALHHLAIVYDRRGDRKHSRPLWERGVKIGRAAIPKRFKRGSSRITWEHLENRPFLRCLHGHALALYHDGRTDEALSVLREMLDYNPEDNLGAEEIMMDVFLKTGRYEEAAVHADRYHKNHSPAILYGKTLSRFMLSSQGKAETALSQAMRTYPRVAEELVKSRHRRPPDSRPGYFSPGGWDEAYDYWESQGRFWPKEAVGWVRERLKATTRVGDERTINTERY